MERSLQYQSDHQHEHLIDQLLELLLAGDWKSLEPKLMAQQCGLSEMEFKQHFPDIQSMIAAVNQRITEQFLEHLDLSSSESLKQSWLSSLNSPRFMAIVKLFLDAGQHRSVAWRLANIGWTQLNNHVANKLGYHAVNQDLPWLLGKSLLKLVSQRPKAANTLSFSQLTGQNMDKGD